jgi:Clostripain family
MGDSAERETAAWTVLVYMAGDNNLTEEMAWGLQELKKKATELDSRTGLKQEDRINVVAHFDPRGSRSRRYDFSPPSAINEPPPQAGQDGDLHRYEGMIYTRQNNANGNDRGDAGANAEAPARSRPLVTFVSEQVAKLRKAQRYFLILSGHGSGAAGDFLTGSDSRASLSIPELASILGAARARYARYFGEEQRTIDILGMDSCLMSNAEVCYEIREHADYLVASEGWVANAGWPYHRVLEACMKPPFGSPEVNRDPELVALGVAESYANFYQDYEIAGISTDISVCKLQGFRRDEPASVVERLRTLSRAFIGSFDAAFVQEVLLRTDIDESGARDLQATLCDQIASLLGKNNDDEKRRLSALLAHRWTPPKETPKLDELSVSQRKAVTELMESLGGTYGPSEAALATEIDQRWGSLPDAPFKIETASVALAFVRLLREFDHGILHALETIEAQERDGRPQAKQARAILQKLHQVRWMLELREWAKDVKDVKDNANVQLLNAVVAARWRAQSFKGGVYVDLFDFCERLARRLEGHKAGALCEQVSKAVSLAILTSRHTGAASQHAHGLSVYFPCHAADYAAEYDTLEFAKKTGWGRVVRSYLRATRRERRGETECWANADDQVVRFGRSEVDPLEADGIEARIVGVVAPPSKDGPPAKAGAKGGTEAKIRGGTEAKIRGGTEAKIRGEGVLFEWGNPPDGFFRPAENGKAAEIGKWDVKSEVPPNPFARS